MSLLGVFLRQNVACLVQLIAGELQLLDSINKLMDILLPEYISAPQRVAFEDSCVIKQDSAFSRLRQKCGGQGLRSGGDNERSIIFVGDLDLDGGGLEKCLIADI